MSVATVTSKGQITIPKLIRETLGLRTGDSVSFIHAPDGSIVIRAKKTPFEQIAGMLKPRGGKKVSIEGMDEGIRAHIRKKHGPK